jgi:hypothetical protein
MNIQHYTHPNQLERYSFWWSEARLLIAAAALFLGGVPPLIKFGPELGQTGLGILKLAWIVSGVATAYMLFRWTKNGQRLFGRKERYDLLAFAVTIVSGLNLGIVGLTNVNWGMRMLSGDTVFVLVGLIYIAAAVHLFKRWNSAGARMF